MTFHNIADVVQSKSITFYIVYVSGRNTKKFLKYFPLISFCYSNTGITNRKNQFVGRSRQLNINASMILSIFHSIIDKIVNHVGKVNLATSHIKVVSRSLIIHFNISLFKNKFHGLKHLFNDSIKIDLFRNERNS